MESFMQRSKEPRRVESVRCEARSGTTLGGENYLRDGVFPKAPRLIWQAGDNEREPV